MELRHLHYFVAVAQTLNYRAAAATLHVSAPALSRQIKDLERELGARLFDRNTQSVRLTNSGTVFLTEVRAILSHVDRACEFAREAEEGRRGRLTIGTIGRRLSHCMPQCLTTFQTRYPEIQVDLVEMDYAEQLAALEAGTLDVGFMPEHIAITVGTRFQHETILSAPIFAVLSRRHRLARGRKVALADLAKERLLFLGKTKSSMCADFARPLFASRKLIPNEMVEVKGFQTLITMIASKQGVSLLGFESIASGAPGVVLRPLKETGADLTLKFCAVFRHYASKTSRPVDHFLTTLHEVILSRFSK